MRRIFFLLVCIAVLTSSLPLRSFSASIARPALRAFASIGSSVASNQLIQNGGFEESSDTGWIEHSVASTPCAYSFTIVQQSYLDVIPFSGRSMAVLGPTRDLPPCLPYESTEASFTTSRLSQLVMIPAGATAMLSYHYQIRSMGSCGLDKAYVRIKELTLPTLTLVEYDLCREQQTGGWVTASLDLSEFSGRSFYLQFEVRLDETVASHWMIDDVTLGVITLPVFLPMVVHAKGGNGSDCQPSLGTGGFEPGSYETTVAGLDAALIIGEAYDPETPTHLAFYLHGDSGDSIIYSEEILEFIDEQGWVLFIPASPAVWHQLHTEEQRLSLNRSWWTGAVDTRADLLAGAFDQLFAEYNLCRNRLVGAGASGGSVFYSGHFVPAIGDRFPAYVLLNCGGYMPSGTFRRHTDQDDFAQAYADLPVVMASTQLKFSYASGDFVRENVKDAVQFYTEAGYDVIDAEFEADEHCAGDVDGEIAAYFRQFAAQQAAD